MDKLALSVLTCITGLGIEEDRERTPRDPSVTVKRQDCLCVSPVRCSRRGETLDLCVRVEGEEREGMLCPAPAAV